MSGIMGRLKRAEEAAGTIRQPPEFQWLEAGDPVPEDGDGVIYFSWADGPAELPLGGQRQAREPADKADVDAEIEKLLAELRAAGLTDKEIAEALGESSPQNGPNELATNVAVLTNAEYDVEIMANTYDATTKKRPMQDNRVAICHREIEEGQTDTAPQPAKATELVSMFRQHRLR